MKTTKGSILYGLGVLSPFRIYDGRKKKRGYMPKIQSREEDREPDVLDICSYSLDCAFMPHYFSNSIYIVSKEEPYHLRWKGRAYWNGKRIKSTTYPIKPRTYENHT